VNRSGAPAGFASAAGTEWASGDAMDAAFAAQASEGAAVVYFALNPPYHQWQDVFPTLQANVLAGAQAAGAKLVAMENLYMFGTGATGRMTEGQTFSPSTKKGRVRAQMATALVEAHQRGDVRTTAARASDIVGPRVLESAMGSRVVPAVMAGKAGQVLGSPDQPHTYTYMSDIGQALVELALSDAADGRAWHVPSPRTVSTRQFAQLIADAAGSGEAKVRSAPKLLLRGMGLFNPAVREVVEMVYQFEEPFVVDATEYTAQFGHEGTSLEDVAAATVAWYRDQESG
jgi:nucleoside-diphosphate-sugar epimerase